MLTPLQFTQRAAVRFADNEFQHITEKSFRDFGDDIRSTFVALAAVNVPDYEPGRYYAAGFVIRHSFGGGTPVFLAAGAAGLLPEPTDPELDPNWLPSLSPASGPVLSQVGTVKVLRRERGNWVAGRLYVLVGRTDGQRLPDVYVRALTNEQLEGEGYAFDSSAVNGQPLRVRYDLATDETAPISVDAYTRDESDAQLRYKADLVNGRVPESELPARAIGNIDFRHRHGSNGGVIAITSGSYWHVSGDVTLNLLALAIEDVFFLRISSFASNVVWTRLLAMDGSLIGSYPQGTALLFRRNGTGPADLAVITVSSEYPSYANAFVPEALKTAVAGGDYTDNQLDTTPAGSVATMQFRDEGYLYFCLLDEQVTNGRLTYAWLRVARVGSATAAPGGEQYTNEKAQDAVAALLAAGTHQGIEFTYDDAGNKLSAKVTATAGSTRPSQHLTFLNARLTSILFVNTLPTSLSLSAITNLARVAAQVNYQDANNPGVWLVCPARVSTGATPAELAALATDLLADMATIPAASLPIAAEVQLLTYPLDSAQEAGYFLTGLGAGQYLGRAGFFRTVYTGPPQGNLLANSQFTDASTWATYGGSINLGGGQAAYASGGGIYQRLNLQPDRYELRLRILNLDSGGSVQVLAEVPAGAAAGSRSFYGPGDYTLQFDWPGGEIQVRAIGTASAVLGHLYLLPA
ncbi:MAG: hypothetical protein ACRYF0_02735 [Janthinobacterium lividum]